jgi:hypothetical protein
VLLSRVLLPLAALAAASGGEALVWRVEPGTTLVRTIRVAHELDLASLVLAVNGEDLSGDSANATRFHVERELTLAVTDRVVEAAGGRGLRRTFDRLRCRESSAFASGDWDESEEKHFESPLEGASVEFAPDEETGRARAAFAAGEARDAALLAGLEEDLDLRWLLPPAAVEVGDEWEIDAASFRHVLDPGGELAFVEAGSPGPAPDDREGTSAALRANLAGSLRVRFEGLEPAPGARIARLAVEAEVRTNAGHELGPEELAGAASGTQRIATAFRMRGELRWDLERGHARSLELAGPMEHTLEQVVQSELAGKEIEERQTTVLAGQRTLSIAVERR